MRIRFWGTRGSIPVALTGREIRDRVAQAIVLANGRALDTLDKARAFVDDELPFELGRGFGGHSSCVEFEPGGQSVFVCDMGSGARAFGEQVLARHAGTPATINIFMSHLHWDHIMGFPFFGPAYTPSSTIRIFGCHDELERAFLRQQDPISFPVPFSALAARIEFVRLQPGVSVEVDGVRVLAKRQLHPGDSYGWRFESAGRCWVYSTDSEHKLGDTGQAQAFVEFFAQADLVVFDAMYSLDDAVSVKADWGHSSNITAVELCQRAGVRRLALFHHEPASDDATLQALLQETLNFEQRTRAGPALEVFSAYDGLEVRL